jgi:hypothetical protein
MKQAAAFLIALLPVPALAQETDAVPGGLRPYLELGQTFEANDNPELDTENVEARLLSITRLDFGLLSETPVDRFSLNLGTDLRLESRDDPFFDDNRVRLGYAREVADSTFGIEARYRESRFEFFDPLTEIFDDGLAGGDVPDDFQDVARTGTRIRYDIVGTLDLGTEAPLGNSLTTGLRSFEYRDTGAADLTDNQRIFLLNETHFRMSPVTELRLVIDYENFQEEDDTNDDFETWRAGLVVSHDLSPVLTLAAGLGRASIDHSVDDGVVTNTRGTDAHLRLDMEHPLGPAHLRADRRVSTSGIVHGFAIGREFDLPLGPFFFEIGAAQQENLSIEPIGALYWTRQGATSQLSVRFDRGVRIRETGNRLETAMILDYRQNLTALWGLDLRARYADSDTIGVGDDTNRASFSAGLRRNLTRDWAMVAGYRYETREVNNSGRARSNAVFATLRRRFDF